MRVRTALGLAAALATATGVLAGSGAASADRAEAVRPTRDRTPVEVKVLSPERGDRAGIDGRGWLVDLEVTFPGGLVTTALPDPASPFQLSGPAGHNNVPPLPGTFSTGKDDRFPGIVVLASTTVGDRPGFSGPGTNLANLFNVTGLSDVGSRTFEVMDTWLVGADIAGKEIDTVLTVAVVADLDENGAFDDAPAVLEDLTGDGRVDHRDLERFGVASNIVRVPFHLNGPLAP